jgi:hypothetical protein
MMLIPKKVNELDVESDQRNKLEVLRNGKKKRWSLSIFLLQS